MSLIPNDEDRARQAGFTQGAAMAEAENARLRAEIDRLRGLLTRMLQWDQFNPPMTGDHAWWKQQIRDALAGAADQPNAIPCPHPDIAIIDGVCYCCGKPVASTPTPQPAAAQSITKPGDMNAAFGPADGSGNWLPPSTRVYRNSLQHPSVCANCGKPPIDHSPQYECGAADQPDEWRPPARHCQNGGDVCLAGNRDRICCPDDSCDIDDGTRPDPRTTGQPDAAREIERANLVYERGAFVLMELMKAYERRVRSDCKSQADLDAKPWECAEYRAAADFLRKTWPTPAAALECAHDGKCTFWETATMSGILCHVCGKNFDVHTYSIADNSAAAPCGHIWVYSTSVRDWECTKCGRRGRTADNSPAAHEPTP